MPLILGGGGSAEQEATNLDHLVMLLGGLRLLYLPLAASDPSDPRFVEWIRSVFSPRGVTDIEICRSVQGASLLNLSDFGAVFIGGGNTYRLLHRLRTTGLASALISAAGRGLTIYGGSAGAIVLGAHIDTCAHLDDNAIGLLDTCGLDLCDGRAVWCHFDQADRILIERLVRRRSNPILGLSENSGVLVDATNVWSLGATPVDVWSSDGPTRLPKWSAA